jgi:asparagine synthase (glutamine-hydrolysing)
MCGIGGAIGRPDDAALQSFTSACFDANARRGPDHREERELAVGDWRIRLAHNRLTILDLTPSGNQPMEGGNDDAWITYNGEIYNYRELRAELTALGYGFRSTSDTEVLLAAYAEWGETCLERLNGMFAFGLLDRGRRRFLLVRDRFGVKPLHVHAGPTFLCFASTPRPIADRVGREPDPVYLARAARYGLFDDDSSHSPYRAVRAIRPGHVAVVSLDGPALSLEERPFYSLADRVHALVPAMASLDKASAVSQCREKVRDAVSLRLRADVPVAVSLSGGVDSATVAALAREGQPDLTGFSYGHPDRSETEGPMIARIAAQTGMRVEYVWPGPKPMVRFFWQCLEAQDAPFMSASVVAQYAVFQAVHGAGVKVLLGGQGGDEIFMGYRKYLAWQWLSQVRRARVAGAVRSGVDLGRALWAQRDQWRTYVGAAGRLRAGGGTDSLLRPVDLPAAPYASPAGTGLEGRQIADITTGGLPTLLRYEDRNSMGNSVESRLPYLDYRLVEWAIAAPVSTKLSGGYGKWMLRRVARDRLPREVGDARGKRGFDVRLEEWIEAGLGREIRAELAGTWARIRDHFVPDARPDDAFADRALTGVPRRFADAVLALWLGRCLA